MSEGAAAFGKGKLESAQQALDELRKQSLARCNRFEQAGLTAHWIMVIGELYEAAEHARLRKSLESAGQPIGLAFGEALSLLDIGGASSGTGGEESNRVRDSVLLGGSDPSSPAPTLGTSRSVVLGAATRTRIEEGITGL